MPTTLQNPSSRAREIVSIALGLLAKLVRNLITSTPAGGAGTLSWLIATRETTAPSGARTFSATSVQRSSELSLRNDLPVAFQLSRQRPSSCSTSQLRAAPSASP